MYWFGLASIVVIGVFSRSLVGVADCTGVGDGLTGRGDICAIVGRGVGTTTEVAGRVTAGGLAAGTGTVATGVAVGIIFGGCSIGTAAGVEAVAGGSVCVAGAGLAADC